MIKFLFIFMYILIFLKYVCYKFFEVNFIVCKIFFCNFNDIESKVIFGD